MVYEMSQPDIGQRNYKMDKETNSTQNVKRKSFSEMIQELEKSISSLDEVYDAHRYLTAMVYQTGQLDYYYSNFKQGEDYMPRIRPLEGQVAYINLTCGFPKELEGGHWCYIVKDIGCKMFVIPVCSVKADSIKNNDLSKSEYVDYVDVYFDSSIHTVAKISYSDARMVGVQRIDQRKPYGTVKISREHIIGRFSELML